jgi:hypothetical protein
MTKENPPRNIDDIPVEEFFGEFITFFGGERAMGLIGWAMAFSLVGVWKPATLRKELEHKGLTRSATYRALADFRRFGEYLEAKDSCPSVTLKDLCCRLVSLSGNSQFVPLMGK